MTLHERAQHFAIWRACKQSDGGLTPSEISGVTGVPRKVVVSTLNKKGWRHNPEPKKLRRQRDEPLVDLTEIIN